MNRRVGMEDRPLRGEVTAAIGKPLASKCFLRNLFAAIVDKED